MTTIDPYDWDAETGWIEWLPPLKNHAGEVVPCDACQTPMTVLEEGQRMHPLCAPGQP